jgi:hypothetical protein
LKKYKFQGKAVEVTVNSKEENSSDYCLGFVQDSALGQVTQKWHTKCGELFHYPNDRDLTAIIIQRVRFKGSDK